MVSKLFSNPFDEVLSEWRWMVLVEY
jgi:hypothetical protein